MSGSTARHVQLTARQLQVLEALRDGPKNTTDLHKATGLSPTIVYRVLEVWEERKVVKRTKICHGRGVRGYHFLWSLRNQTLRFKHPSCDAIITIAFPRRRKS